jgi:hypothetical protein
MTFSLYLAHVSRYRIFKRSLKLSTMRTKRKAAGAFWGTSAIVPLCCQQNLSQSVRKRWRETSRAIVWWGATVEVGFVCEMYANSEKGDYLFDTG